MDTRKKEYWMTQLPGIDPEKAAVYAACVQPHITLFLDDVEDFDYDSEYAGDWLPGFLRWVDPLAAPETARKLAEAGARIEKLKEALESAEPYWRLGNGSLVAECEFALKFDGVEDCKRCSYKPSQCQCEP